MELDLENDYKDRAYQLLASLVTPRPIALVTTVDSENRINAAPFSFFNLLGSEHRSSVFVPATKMMALRKTLPGTFV